MPRSDYLSVWTQGWWDSAGGGAGVDMPSVGTIGWFEESTDTGVVAVVGITRSGQTFQYYIAAGHTE